MTRQSNVYTRFLFYRAGEHNFVKGIAVGLSVVRQGGTGWATGICLVLEWHRFKNLCQPRSRGTVSEQR